MRLFYFKIVLLEIGNTTHNVIELVGNGNRKQFYINE